MLRTTSKLFSFFSCLESRSFTFPANNFINVWYMIHLVFLEGSHRKNFIQSPVFRKFQFLFFVCINFIQNGRSLVILTQRKRQSCTMYTCVFQPMKKQVCEWWNTNISTCGMYAACILGGRLNGSKKYRGNSLDLGDDLAMPMLLRRIAHGE